jgi:hypothetical protein
MRLMSLRHSTATPNRPQQDVTAAVVRPHASSIAASPSGYAIAFFLKKSRFVM